MRSTRITKSCYSKIAMQYKYQQNKELKIFSRKNRREQTEAERLLWQHIRNKQISGLKFRRQYPIGTYILDFYCPEKKLAIELDGSQHMQHARYDDQRTRYLKKFGIELIRFWDNEIFQNLEGIKLHILEKAAQH